MTLSKPSSGDTPGPERRRQRCLIDDRSPGDVDHLCLWLHALELGDPDEMVRLLRQRTADNDEVRRFQQLVET